MLRPPIAKKSFCLCFIHKDKSKLWISKQINFITFSEERMVFIIEFKLWIIKEFFTLYVQRYVPIFGPLSKFFVGINNLGMESTICSGESNLGKEIQRTKRYSSPTSPTPSP